MLNLDAKNNNKRINTVPCVCTAGKETVLFHVSDESLSVEDLWVLSLALKLLNNSLKSADNCSIESLYTPDFIQCLVSTASKGTGFSQQWLLKDLEVSSSS